jgi:hypothetical protein
MSMEAEPALALDLDAVPAPDASAAPSGFVVEADSHDRIHFLDWGGPADGPGVLLIHGLPRQRMSGRPSRGDSARSRA